MNRWHCAACLAVVMFVWLFACAFAPVQGQPGGAAVATAPDSAVRSAAEPSPAPLPPNLKYPTLADYEEAVGEPGLILDSPHVRMYAPRTRSRDVDIIFPYLVRAYDELHKITGRHTRYRIIVYHFPQGHIDFSGGTSNCVIRYGYANLDLDSQKEWIAHKVPHVSGYIEEMAHNFVDATRVQFGWEMIGWTIGTHVTQKVANNPILAREVASTRKVQMETFRRYVKAGHVFPEDIEPNLCDRVHAWLLYLAEMQYGPGFWPDFFAEADRRYDTLDAAGDRNARYRITIECFGALGRIRFREVLRRNRISLTTDVKSLDPEGKTGKAWDRTFLSPEERSQGR